MIDLEFDSSNGAEAFRAALQGLWRRVQRQVMENPRARIVDAVESKE